MNLRNCVPQDKFDLAAVARAKQTGFPAINPILPELLLWLQDINWPVANEVVDLLSGSDAEIVPAIRVVLQSDDAVWKYWVLNKLCSRLTSLVLAELIPDIARLANDPTEEDRSEDVDAEAKVLLGSF